MAGTVSASVSGGTITVTGSGYSGSKAVVSVSFTSTDGKRKHNEMAVIDVSAGAINHPYKFPYASGTAVVKTFDSSYAVQATSSNQAV